MPISARPIAGTGAPFVELFEARLPQVLADLLDGPGTGALDDSDSEALRSTYRRLDSFDINISGAPDIASLFHQLRGEGVNVTTNQGVAEGTILSVERRDLPAPEGRKGETE